MVSTSIGVHLDPTTSGPPLLAHPLPPVRDLDPGAISGDDDILSEELGKNRQREIETLDPAEERGIIGCFEARNECRGSPNKSLHLTVGPLQEGVNVAITQRLRILKRPTTLASVHLGGWSSLIDEVQRQVKLTAKATHYIYSVAIVRVSQRSFWHEGAEDVHLHFCGQVTELFNTASVILNI